MGSEYVTLMGAEDVLRAGKQISSAADDISRAIGSLDDYLFRLQRLLETHEENMRQILEERNDGN